MLGAFVALNLFLFYVFWELMLIPMYFIIGIWGGPRRVYAAVKFFLYTMVGSLLMLVAILVLYCAALRSSSARSTSISSRRPGGAPALLDTVDAARRPGASGGRRRPGSSRPSRSRSRIKVPMLPFHTWLPDAHVEAPTAGSVILAGVLLKMGTYGFVRFALPLFPDAAIELAPRDRSALALVGILYGALVAMVQTDVKKLVAYSSVAHLGFVMLGIFALNVRGPRGRVLQMVNHGLSTGALFLLVGMIYERRHTRLIADFGGIAKLMPVFAALFVIVAMSSIGLPGAERLRRRVPDPARHVPREPRGSAVARDLRRGARRGLHALDVPARVLRPGREAREPRPDRPRPAREARDARACSSRSSGSASIPNTFLRRLDAVGDRAAARGRRAPHAAGRRAARGRERGGARGFARVSPAGREVQP